MSPLVFAAALLFATVARAQEKPGFGALLEIKDAAEEAAKLRPEPRPKKSAYRTSRSTRTTVAERTPCQELEDAANKLDVDAAPLIEACLESKIANKKPPVLALRPGRYFLRSPIAIAGKEYNGLTFSTTRRNAPCNPEKPEDCAVLTATSQLAEGPLLFIDGVDGIRVASLGFDGAFGRGRPIGCDYGAGKSLFYGTNLYLGPNTVNVEAAGIATWGAPCSGMLSYAGNIRVTESSFVTNAVLGLGLYSLTRGKAFLARSKFNDSGFISLQVATPDAQLVSNTFELHSMWALAAIHVFGSPNVKIQNNVIDGQAGSLYDVGIAAVRMQNGVIDKNTIRRVGQGVLAMNCIGKSTLNDNKFEFVGGIESGEHCAPSMVDLFESPGLYPTGQFALPPTRGAFAGCDTSYPGRRSASFERSYRLRVDLGALYARYAGGQAPEAWLSGEDSYAARLLAGSMNFDDAEQAILSESAERQVSLQDIPKGVDWLYRACLGRAPDAGGAEFWEGRVRQDGSYKAAFGEFCVNGEERQNLRREGWVHHLYLQCLSRPADPSGLAAWSRSGLSYDQLAEQICRSAEAQKTFSF
ncbi:MAG: right-handed parallel beta-helix repeat-containing protein [Elusimicrobia bacterium]|nr:right-handed parallel beta-helix repeat-containing protein [Elusimicrobiota bacterium]